MKNISIKLFALVIFGFAQIAGSYVSQVSAQPGFLKQPVKAPKWAIEEWVVGPATSLEQLKGKVVIVDFFNFGAPAVIHFPCR